MVQLRLSPSGQEILGVNPGDTLVWSGTEWVPQPGGGAGQDLAAVLALGNDANNSKITNLQAPTNPNDAARLADVASQSLSTTLANGPTTGPNPIVVTAGGQINSDIGVPLNIFATGANLGLAGDGVGISAVNGAMSLHTSAGAGIDIVAGEVGFGLAPLNLKTANTGGGTSSGAITCKTGDVASTGQSGEANFGSGDTVSGQSGDVALVSGDSVSGDSGDIVVETGSAPGGVRGTIRLGGRTMTLVVGAATYVMPATDGTTGQVLSTDGSGNLSWITP